MFCRPWIMSSYNRPLSGWPAAALRPCLARIGARIGALARDRRGMSAVEFGLAAPVFLAMLTPVIDIGLALRILDEVSGSLSYRDLDDDPRFAGKLTTTEFLARFVHDELRARLGGAFDGTFIQYDHLIVVTSMVRSIQAAAATAAVGLIWKAFCSS